MVILMKTIKDFNLENKKVIIRVDFNVPIKDGKIIDDTRIVESLETIKYAINNNAKVILLSHLGRVKDKEAQKLIDNCRIECCTNKPTINGIKIESEYHPLELWAFAARWAELLTRSN